MKQRKLLIAVVTLCAVTAVSRASSDEAWVELQHNGELADTLVPGASIGATSFEKDYGAILKAVFGEFYAPNACARMLYENAFEGGLGGGGEGGLAVKQSGVKYFIVAADSTRWLWQYTEGGKEQAVEFKLTLRPADYRQVQIKRCMIPIDPAFGHKLIGLWQAMLVKASYHHFDDPPADDVWVDFSTTTDRGSVSASIYTGYRGHKVHSLIDIAFALHDYCMMKKRSALNDAMQSADQLTAMLAEKKAQ